MMVATIFHECRVLHYAVNDSRVAVVPLSIPCFQAINSDIKDIIILKSTVDRRNQTIPVAERLGRREFPQSQGRVLNAADKTRSVL